MDVKMCPKRCQPDPQPVEEFRLITKPNGKQYRIGSCRACRNRRQLDARHRAGVSTVRGRPCSGMRTCRGCSGSFPLTDEFFHPTVIHNGKQYFHNYCHDCRRARTRKQYHEKRDAWQDPMQFQMCAAGCSTQPLPITAFPVREGGKPRRTCTQCFNAIRRAASVASQIPISELVCNWRDALKCNQCPHVAKNYHELFAHKHEAHSSLPYGLSAFSITPSTLGAFANECV